MFLKFERKSRYFFFILKSKSFQFFCKATAADRELVLITQRMKNYTYNIPPSLLAQTADGRWLLWTESNDENAHVAYGLIAPNDFAAGSTDYTPVEMWAG